MWIIGRPVVGLDCVSIGPDLTEIHTCGEKMCISEGKPVKGFATRQCLSMGFFQLYGKTDEYSMNIEVVI